MVYGANLVASEKESIHRLPTMEFFVKNSSGLKCQKQNLHLSFCGRS